MKVIRWQVKRTTRLQTALLLLALIARPSLSSEALSPIKILDGYSIRKSSAVDATSRTIQRIGGLSIQFEAGFSEGMWADPKDADSYSWSRVQTVSGYKGLFALVKPGLRTRWEPKADRGLPPGNTLLVTFLLGGDQSFHTANFAAKLANDKELADMMLMVMTFDPSKGSF